MTASLNIDVPRNGEFYREITLVAQDGNPIDLTGAAVSASARDIPGGTVVASATVVLIEASAGKFTLRWTGSDFDSFGSAAEIARPSYDVKVVRAGLTEIPFRGYLNLLPENTA